MLDIKSEHVAKFKASYERVTGKATQLPDDAIKDLFVHVWRNEKDEEAWNNVMNCVFYVLYCFSHQFDLVRR